MFVRPITLLATAALAVATVAPGLAAGKDSDSKFFERVEGEWAGPGEIVAGKYKGTKFTCKLSGSTPNKTAGMTLDGSCRVGVFTQKMKATIARTGRQYRGQFLDGAKGEGLDITSGNVDGDRVVFSLNRDKLKGAMLARLSDNGAMNVTVSVRVGKELVPVIGMNLSRIDSMGTGAVK
jgi:hypothetical protein